MGVGMWGSWDANVKREKKIIILQSMHNIFTIKTVKAVKYIRYKV